MSVVFDAILLKLVMCRRSLEKIFFRKVYFFYMEIYHELGYTRRVGLSLFFNSNFYEF